MKNTKESLIEAYDLLPHPEGGWYKECYRSEIQLPENNRNLVTSIYFLLTSENISRFHRIKSDEMWYFHQGNPVTVHTLDENGHQKHQLGNDLSKGEHPFLIVKANTIFGSSIDQSGGFGFVSCVVSPGFSFHDFELFTTDELLKWFPNEAEIIERLS
jgi:hypothetical protein